jgi:plastocyanin
MNLKNLLLVICVLAVLLFVGFLGSQSTSNKKSPETSSSVQEEPDVTVKLVDQGKYEPETVVIKAGQVVRWVNDSKGLMWVASNPHPSHTDLSGFDQKEILRNGASWQFKFVNPGQYFYHDHLEPSRRGKVIVEESL